MAKPDGPVLWAGVPSSPRISASPQAGFRVAVLAFAAILGAQAAWILVAGAASALPGGGTCLAARVALWRGDYWAACAQAGGREGAEAAEHAVRLAPHEAGAWLVLARHPPPGGNAADCLKMSYYTGPNAAELMAQRLAVSVEPAMLGDDDIRLLMRHDIAGIVSRHQLPSIVTAHRQASPEGRRAIEAAVGEVDAALPGALRAGTRSP